MKKWKTTGLGDISIEMLQVLEDFGVEITDPCNDVYKPQDLKTSVFIVLQNKTKRKVNVPTLEPSVNELCDEDM